MKRIEVIVSPTGETTLATGGYAGSSCREASKFLEDALGARTSETLTAEFHHVQTHQHQQHEQQGTEKPCR
ncbi:MAG: DUF2997 domain-containing protein [Planctomycetales bacterium]